jgi:5'-deoxynucleotidase YfbR-like HD superfamily hydrolase
MPQPVTVNEHDSEKGRSVATRARVTIRTFTGKTFSPLDPCLSDVDIVDIAHSLANLCRYVGHTRRLYTVAQHSVLVAGLLRPPHRAWGLLHDAAEAYLGDMAATIKRADVPLGVAYRRVEEQVMRVVAERFGLAWPEPAEVAAADRALFVAEFRDLMHLEPGDLERLVAKHGQAYPDAIVPCSSEQAKAAFLETFRQLQSAGELK